MSIAVMSLLAVGASLNSCGWRGSAEVPPPTLSVECGQDAGQACSGLAAEQTWAIAAYLMTTECTAGVLVAGQYSYVGAATLVHDEDCLFAGCNTSIETWAPPGVDPSGVTTITEGTYKVCVLIDANGDGTLGNTGDYLGHGVETVMSRATTSSGSIELTINSFSVL